MYHLALALTPEQVKALRHRALSEGLPVNRLVTRLVLEALDKAPDSVSKSK